MVATRDLSIALEHTRRAEVSTKCLVSCAPARERSCTAAEAIYWAAHEKRREVFVGLPTMQAILGNKVAPGLLDHYLAKAAYDGHQTGEPEDPNRPDNLMEPVPGDHGAHGTFDARASGSSPAFWAVNIARSSARWPVASSRLASPRS